jgi:hypothetical protein
LFLGVPGCLAAGWFELTRAMGGREVAWVYTFEWPFYAVAGSYMWWKIWHRNPQAYAGAAASVSGHGEQDAVRQAPERPDDDPELAAWQRYLANLEALDPPGGPPSRS